MKLLTRLLLASLTLGSTQAELVAHWPLDADALDATGNGYDGTVVSGTVNFGQTGANANTGSSASFPDNGHIDVPFDQAINPESFTVALWANAASTGGFASPLTSRDDVPNPGGSVHGYILYNDSAGNWSYWTGTGGPSGAWNQSVGPAVLTNTWTHLAITYDAPTQTKTLYVDGQIAVTETMPNLYSPNGTIEMENLHIGSGSDAGDNFFFDGLIDDVGVWDEALDQAVIQSIIDNGIASGLPDPALTSDSVVEVALDGTVQQFDIPITNGGQTQNLIISSADFGADANFSVNTIPGSISPGGTENLVISFDPAGGNGLFESTLSITSNDSVVPNQTITIRGVLHDPMLVSESSLALGESTSGALTITNTGATRSLNITGLNFTGPNADNFSAVTGGAIAPNGGTGTIDVTFDPEGEDGSFLATLEIISDDPLVPSVFIDVSATVPLGNPLVAWWPLDVDGTDASGNGFDGTIVGALTTAPGANAATGGSLQFDGASRIDVPFDPELNPQDFTVTLWANAASTGGFASPITSRDDVGGGTSTHGYILYNDNGGNWNFWTGDGNPGWDTLSGGPVTPSTWTHIAMTYDSITETKSIYLDGVLAASDTAPNQYSPNGTVETESLHIGAGQDDGLNFWFNGQIDDVGLFRTALTEEQINSIIANGVGSFAVPARELVITDLTFGPGDGEVTITFDSVEGATYIVERSTDLFNWIELTDNEPSDGETTTFIDFTLPANSTKVFYRVSRP